MGLPLCELRSRRRLPRPFGLGTGSVPGPVHGESFVIGETDGRAFVELTAANELDLAIVNDDFACQFGADLLALFRRARDRLSDPAWEACSRVLAGPNAR